MARYSYSGNKKHKKKQNHASEYLPYLINELADEIEIVEQVLSGGEEEQVLTADSNGKAQWAEASGGGGALASFSYEPGENENWGDLFVLYPAAAEALHLNLNEQMADVTVYIMLQLAESPYHMLEISRALKNGVWNSKAEVPYSLSLVSGGSNPPSGTYNILSVRMKMGGM